jgi:hypothetical protein
MCWGLDADIQQYFDTIPHERLMKVVATRVVDGSMLALIKMFLSAPVIDPRAGGGPRRPAAGVPQGGVVSPLLANIWTRAESRLTFSATGSAVAAASGWSLISARSHRCYPRQAARADAADVSTAERARRQPEFVHPWGQGVLPIVTVVVETSSRQLPRTADGAPVSAQARTEIPGMVAPSGAIALPVSGLGAPHPPRARCARVRAGAPWSQDTAWAR